jgi:hypothetical protein
MRITGWGASDVGRKRHHNEDSLLCNNELKLFAVADGMGGHLGGERASRMAVEILEREIEKARQEGLLSVPLGDLPPGEPHPLRVLLRRAVVAADRHLRGRDDQPRPCRDGNDADHAAVSRGLRPPRARRRLPRLPVPRRARPPAQRGSLVDPGAGAGRPDLARGGEGVALPQHHHALGGLRTERVEPDLQGMSVQAGDCFVPARMGCRTTSASRSWRRC